MTESMKVTALGLMKARLNRTASDTALDAYFEQRIQATADDIEGTGIRLREKSPGDLMLLVDNAVYDYQNRDQAGGMPEWLRLRRRERWLWQRRIDEEEKAEGCGCDT